MKSLSLALLIFLGMSSATPSAAGEDVSACTMNAQLQCILVYITAQENADFRYASCMSGPTLQNYEILACTATESASRLLSNNQFDECLIDIDQIC